MLSDAGSAAIKRFGLLNPAAERAIGPDKDDPEVQAEVRKYVSVVRPSAMMAGIAFPGTFILDTQGRVKQRFFEDFYVERNTVSDILIKLGSSPSTVAGTRISSAHVDLTTYPSSPDVAPGDRFSVALDIEPHPGVHVYAPGAKGYKGVPLQKKFRLVQEMVLEGTPQAQAALRGKASVTLKGTLI